MPTRIEVELGYRIPPAVRAESYERANSTDAWVLKLLDERQEIGWAQTSLWRATGRYLGREEGPAFVLDYLTIVDEHAGGLRHLRNLFRAVIEFVHERDPELGLLIEPANDKVDRLFGEDGFLPLPRVGEPAAFFVLSAPRIRAAMEVRRHE